MFSLGIIPTTGRDKSLFMRSLWSMRRQTEPLDLIIIVDDSKKQNFIENLSILEDEIAIPSGRVHCDAGSRNAGVQYFVDKILPGLNLEPKEVVVSFLDDDDVWHLSKNNIVLRNFELNSDMKLLGGRITYSKAGLEKPPSSNAVQKLGKNHLFMWNCRIGPQSLSFKLDFFIRLGGFDSGAMTHVGREILTAAVLQENVYRSVASLVFVDHHHGKPRTADQRDQKIRASYYVLDKHRELMPEKYYLLNQIFISGYFSSNIMRRLFLMPVLIYLGGISAISAVIIKTYLIQIFNKIRN